MKHLLILLLAGTWLVSCGTKQGQVSESPIQQKVVVGYITSWSDRIPDPEIVTHLNYAFGHVSENYDSIRIDNTERLRAIVALKDNHPQLKVMLSIGGWGSGRFSEMASDERNRLSFAQTCRKVIDNYGLDGIDIDW